MKQQFSERVKKARVFPQGFDWFWGIFYSLLIGVTLGNKEYIWATIIALIGTLVLYTSWRGRVLDAELKDIMEESDKAFNNFINAVKNDLEKEKK